jgi:hypothetical protein
MNKPLVLQTEHLSSYRHQWDAWGRGPFTGNSDSWRALERQHLSLCEGNLEGGSFTKDSERWMKGALEVESLSLSPREFCEGKLEEGLLYWGP